MKTNSQMLPAERFRSAFIATSLCAFLASCGIAVHEPLQFHFGEPAQLVPGQWEKVDLVAPGVAIVITLKLGDRLNGTFKSSSPDLLVLIDANGNDQTVAKSEVQAVVKAERIRDRLTNGALIGAGVGLGVAFAVLASVAATSGEGETVLPSAKVFAPLLGFGAGLGVGIAIDAGHREGEVLYRASR